MYYVGEAPTNIYGNVSSAEPNMNSSAIPAPQGWNDSPAAPQWGHAANAMHQNSSHDFHSTFQTVRPTPLGIVLIVAGVLQIALGIGAACTIPLASTFSGISFWGPIFYIIAGGLTIAASPNPNICLVKGSLSLNIISSVFSFIAFILNCVDLADINKLSDKTGLTDFIIDNSAYKKRLDDGRGLHAVLLILNMLLFSVSLAVSIFGCRSISRVAPNAPQVFVVQNVTVVP